jgi:hypothetical protein
MPKLLKLKTGVDTTTDDIVVKKAQQLATARTINGVPFDGSENIVLSTETTEDSDKVDGFHASIENTEETVVVRDEDKNINVSSVSADWVQLNTSTELLNITEVPGKIFFDETHDTLAIVTNNGDVIQVGETLYTPLVKNNSAVAIPKGHLVMATGSQGDKINIAKAVTDGSIAFDFFIGVASTDIAIDSELGRVVTQGYIKGINTNAWDVGTVLYADPNTPGWWTSTKPELPNYNTATAFVVKKNSSSGVIMVRFYPFNIGGASGGASVTIDNVAPEESNNGDLWWDSLSGNLFINYDDGDSIQWVQVNQNNYPTLTVNSIPELPIEKIINLQNNLDDKINYSDLLLLNSSIIPSNDNAVDLGSPTKKFRELYLSGSTLFIGSLAIKDNNGEIEFQRNNNGTMVAANIKNEIDFTTIRNRPTTLSGLGITDALTLGTHSNTAFRGDHGLLAYNHSQVSDGTNPHATTFDNIASKPTTISGFGITDAVTNTTTINGFNLQSNIILTNDHIDIVSETITSSVTLNINNKNRILKVNSSSAITLTIPSNASVPFPINTEVAIIREGSGTVSIAPGSGVTLLSTDSKRKIKGQYSSAALLKTASDTWLLIGSIEV